MKHSLLFICMTVILASCNSVTGDLQVAEKIKLKANRIFDKSKIKLAPGSYSAKLKSTSGGNIMLVVKVAGKTKKAKFVIPDGANIPTFSGEFSLTAAQVKQNYDIAGVVDTEVTESDSVRTVESCSYSVSRRVCRWQVINPPRPGKPKPRNPRRPRPRPRKRYVCHNEYHTVYGSRHVEYYNVYKDKQLDLELLLPESDIVVATFSGTDHKVNKIYNMKGHCR